MSIARSNKTFNFGTTVSGGGPMRVTAPPRLKGWSEM